MSMIDAIRDIYEASRNEEPGRVAAAQTADAHMLRTAFPAGKKEYRVFAVNPGSTSTKIALFEGERALLNVTVHHDARELAAFPDIPSQLPYRKETIRRVLKEQGVALTDIDACVGRGGGLLPVEGGTYAVDELVLRHALNGENGIQHPALLGVPLAQSFAAQLGCPVYVVNPPDVDELDTVARVTGVKGVYRQSHLHALNLKETAIHHARLHGERYEEKNYIVCHIGGGISVSAHRRGRMVDGNDIARGEGPMTPTRCGSLAAADVAALCGAGGADAVKDLCTKNGGLVSHLGTSDAREAVTRMREGDPEAKLVWDAMLYQIAKWIGAMGAALEGDVDAILLGGGMVREAALEEYIRRTCGFLAPVYAYPGEFEMEAMARGVIRVLSGEETAKRYTGTPVWTPAQAGLRR